ncbi:hypothetical protein D3C81_1658400 [compost metagenome]
MLIISASTVVDAPLLGSFITAMLIPILNERICPANWSAKNKNCSIRPNNIPHRNCSAVRMMLFIDSRLVGMGWGISGVIMNASARDKIMRTRTVSAALSSTGA